MVTRTLHGLAECVRW